MKYILTSACGHLCLWAEKEMVYALSSWSFLRRYSSRDVHSEETWCFRAFCQTTVRRQRCYVFCNRTGCLFWVCLMLSMVASKSVTLKRDVSKHSMKEQYFIMGPLALLIHVDALFSFWMGNQGSKQNSSPSYAVDLFSLGWLVEIDTLIYFGWKGSLDEWLRDR